jgi:hypothetical protein
MKKQNKIIKFIVEDDHIKAVFENGTSQVLTDELADSYANCCVELLNKALKYDPKQS